MEDTKALTVQDKMDIATQFAESKFFGDAREIAQAFVKVQAGQELGIPPFAAMTGIHVIEGKPSMGANLIAGRIKASGKYDYRIVKLDAQECEITFFEGGEVVGTSSFTMEDAAKVQYKAKGGGMQALSTKYNWRQYPRNMLFARAISNGARWYCPDVFSGPVYTPDELGADAEIIDVTPTPVEDPGHMEKLDAPKAEIEPWYKTQTARVHNWLSKNYSLDIDTLHKHDVHLRQFATLEEFLEWGRVECPKICDAEDLVAAEERADAAEQPVEREAML